MQQLDEASHGDLRGYVAVIVNGETVLPRELAERAAAEAGAPHPRFLLPWTEGRGLEKFADTKATVPLAMMPEDSIWRRGLPTRVDLHAVLREGLDGAESPTPSTALVPIESTLELATRLIGPGKSEDVQPHFDAYVMQLDGRIQGAAYSLPIERLLGG